MIVVYETSSCGLSVDTELTSISLKKCLLGPRCLSVCKVLACSHCRSLLSKCREILPFMFQTSFSCLNVHGAADCWLFCWPVYYRHPEQCRCSIHDGFTSHLALNLCLDILFAADWVKYFIREQPATKWKQELWNKSIMSKLKQWAVQQMMI